LVCYIDSLTGVNRNQPSITGAKNKHLVQPLLEYGLIGIAIEIEFLDAIAGGIFIAAAAPFYPIDRV